MQIIEYEKLDKLIKEYIDKKIPLSILVSENNISYKQINYIIKTVKEMLHINDNNAYTNEDYKSILRYIENIEEELKNNNLPNAERIKLEYDKEIAKEELIKSCKSIFDDTINIFFNNVELKEDVYSYYYESLLEVLNDYSSNSRVNFIANLTSKIIKIIEFNFKEIVGMSFEEYKEYVKGDFKIVPEIIDIDKIIDSKENNEDDEKFEEEYFISDDNVEKEIIDNLLGENLEKVIETLPETEAEVIKLRYGFQDNNPKTYAQIANKLNKSPERIRQIEYKALRKLRNPERLRRYYVSPNYLSNTSKNNKELNDRIYLKLIDLLIHDFSDESIIKFINMEGVNWEHQNYINAILILTRMIRIILSLKELKELKNSEDINDICNIISRDTGHIFSRDFIEKLVTDYSSNQDLLIKLNIDISELKL